MKKSVLITSLAIATGFAVAVQSVSPSDVGYAIGYDLGAEAVAGLSEDGVQMEPKDLIAGFTDAVMGEAARLDPGARRQLLTALQRDVAMRLAEQRMTDDPVFAALAEANKQRSDGFHAAYANQQSVQTMPNGLQYRVIEQGSGMAPLASSTVVVSFEARLLNGVVFANEERQELEIEYMFTGARQAVMQMTVGSTWELAIPPALAFGIGGQPPAVGPNETIITTVTLHEARR